MTYKVELTDNMGTPKIVVVGCGGTGSFVAEGLCRLLAKDALDIVLVDYDRVEPRNIIRQNFFQHDLGKFKSQVLAERLSLQYRRRVGYSVFPYDREVINESTSIGIRQNRGIFIGCVDNAAARIAIAKSLKVGDWWLDSGNGYQSGQVLIGNTTRVGDLKGAFEESGQMVISLPAPSLQLPALLQEPTNTKTPQQDCAEAVQNEDQSPTINQMMATLVIDFMHRFLKGTLTWMGAYIDMEAGTLQTVPAEPETVARMFGISTDTLTVNNCSRGMFYTPRRG